MENSKTLETDRLILRKFNRDDFQMLYENYVSDEAVPKYCTWKPCKTQEEANQLLEKWYRGYEDPEKLMWMIVEKTSSQGIGIIRVTDKDIENKSCEIGYSIGSKWWNQGYMTEAVKRVVNHLISDLGFKKITAEVSKENIASIRVLEKCSLSPKLNSKGLIEYSYINNPEQAEER